MDTVINTKAVVISRRARTKIVIKTVIKNDPRIIKVQKAATGEILLALFIFN
jgi:hypothetical protein